MFSIPCRILLVFTVFTPVFTSVLAPAFATTFQTRPFPDTLKSTPVVVHGTVGDSSSEWAKGADGVRRLYTYYDIQVDEALKGQTDENSIQIRELGGARDGVAISPDGAAHFDKGENVVVMLSSANADGSYDLQGMSYGKYVVRPDETGKDSIAIHGSPEKWTLEAVKKLVTEQASQAIAVAPLSQNVASTQTPHPSGAPSAAPSIASAAASHERLSSLAARFSAKFWLFLGGGALLALVLAGIASVLASKRSPD